MSDAAGRTVVTGEGRRVVPGAASTGVGAIDLDDQLRHAEHIAQVMRPRVDASVRQPPAR